MNENERDQENDMIFTQDLDRLFVDSIREHVPMLFNCEKNNRANLDRTRCCHVMFLNGSLVFDSIVLIR
jgi:hypothetical protein